jgi:hypothetical protein
MYFSRFADLFARLQITLEDGFPQSMAIWLLKQKSSFVNNVRYLAALFLTYTVKIKFSFSRPKPGCHLPNTSWPEIIKLFLARESLVSDSRLGAGKMI